MLPNLMYCDHFFLSELKKLKFDCGTSTIQCNLVFSVSYFVRVHAKASLLENIKILNRLNADTSDGLGLQAITEWPQECEVSVKA